jgi:phospholipid transport system transporter-binding protein
VDSAGLALLIEWYSQASKASKSISFVAVPEQLSALAKISDVDQFLKL